MLPLLCMTGFFQKLHLPDERARRGRWVSLILNEVHVSLLAQICNILHSKRKITTFKRKINKQEKKNY